jgi:hypothetical protein
VKVRGLIPESRNQHRQNFGAKWCVTVSLLHAFAVGSGGRPQRRGPGLSIEDQPALGLPFLTILSNMLFEA